MSKFLLLMLAMIAGSAQSFADSDTYELVTSANSLAAGDEVLIAYLNSSTYYAMGAKNSNNRNAVSVTVSSNAIELESTNTSITRFTLGRSSSNWTFYSATDQGYLGVSSSSLTITTSAGTSNYVTLSFNGSTGATNFKIGSSNKYLTMTGNSWSGYRFSTATQSDTNVRIFKKKIIIPDAPTFSLAEGEYNQKQKVKLSTTTPGATIYYTIDGSTPTTSNTQYTGAINIGEGTTTIKAIAVFKGVSSDVATATYVVKLPEKETFHLVTNAAALADGDTIIIVYSPYGKVMGNQISEGNRAYSKFNITNESIVMLKENTAATRIILGGSVSAWTFRAINNTEGFLYNSGTEGYLNTQSTTSDYANATVKIASNGNATITFNAEGNNKLLAYYLDPDAGPGGDDPTPPIVGAPRRVPVAGSEVVECFTFIDAFNEDNGYFPVQIYSKNPHEVVITDINQDGQWDIADVTALVNYLLGNNSNNIIVNACDIDGSGTVDADDIPALINLILEQ